MDYVLLNKEGGPIRPVNAYRDARNAVAAAVAEDIVPFEKLYMRTGIQRVVLNTVYQLCKDRALGRLEAASTYLMVPEYMNYVLTGKKMREFTNTSTTSLLKIGTTDWDWEVIDSLGLPRKIFEGNVHMPGTLVGNLTEEIQKLVGFDAQVVMVGSHDTASAVLGAALDDDSVFISSGTWSLIGVETKAPICTKESMLFNLGNEGGYQNRNRFLRNVMGLWIVQNIRSELEASTGKKTSFKEVASLARKGRTVGLFDVNDQRFFAPGKMLERVREILNAKPATPVPDLIRSVYESLAEGYRTVVDQIEYLTGKKYASINVVGGGSQDDLLNELTKKATGKRVFAGPKEATAIGNFLALLAFGEGITDVAEMRRLVKESAGIKEVV